MTGRECVARAIEFGFPERLPFDMFVSGQSDVFHAHPGKSSDPRQKNSDGSAYTDHFGCAFDVLNTRTMGQPCNFPLPDIRDLASYRFPDPLDEARLEPIGEALRDAGDMYVVSDLIWFTFFERMHFIHGFAQTLEDLYLQREHMEKLADWVTDYNVATVRELDRRHHGKIHGITMSDDWGSQSATFIGRELFDGFFIPRYKRLFSEIRRCGMHVWLHSCGMVADFIPSLMEAGVQVLNLQQPRIFDLAELGRRFAGSVCFNVPIDIQATMPSGSRDEIREEAAILIRHLSTERGGLIASEHPDYGGNGIDPVKGEWAYGAFQEADPYVRRASRGAHSA